MSSSTPRFIQPVILSGGSGTRLWPLSRAEYPKQLLPLAGAETLLQATASRAAALPGTRPALVVTGEEHRFLVRDQLEQAGLPVAALYLEPEGRNTAPAIALAALHVAHEHPDALMLVLPADHLITGQAAFAASVGTAQEAARTGHLCTFGIEPTAPETGYGYIQAGPSLPGLAGAHRVDRFVEKPSAASARELLAAGGYLWNSGIFMFTAQAILSELEAHCPAVLAAIRQAWAGRSRDMGFLRPEAAAFRACPAISIDYAVMQATQRAAVVPAAFGWSDVGSWDSLWRASSKDADNNSVAGDVVLAGTTNSYVRAEHRLVSVVGLDNVAVVETADAVLVMNKDNAQDLREVVAQLQAAGRTEMLRQLRVHRPWGWYEATDRGDRFQVKRIVVNPGKKLSLQMHHHRAEHWVVVSGTALVTVDGVRSLLSENQSAFVPLGRKHQLENPGTIALQLIEVQSGSYLGEDDIVRFED
jgi:mannose-1-phosphate guanylyltransferase/mannose-6-phosphate isomerase